MIIFNQNDCSSTEQNINPESIFTNLLQRWEQELSSSNLNLITIERLRAINREQENVYQYLLLNTNLLNLTIVPSLASSFRIIDNWLESNPTIQDHYCQQVLINNGRLQIIISLVTSNDHFNFESFSSFFREIDKAIGDKS